MVEDITQFYLYYLVILFLLGILSIFMQYWDNASLCQKDVLIISIEGNIGAGKSTLLKHFKEFINKNNIKNISIVEEPVNIWIQTGILKKFYLEKDKYAGFFQLFVLETLKQAIKNCINNYKYNNRQIIITERSLNSTRHVFAQMLYNNKEISDEEYSSYLYVYNNVNTKYLPTKIIYLNTDYITCHHRAIQRNRDGEDTISIEYLKECDEYHKKMINNNKIPVLELNIHNHNCSNIVGCNYCYKHYESFCLQIVNYI